MPKQPTHNDKILDPIITDLHSYYQNPIIEEPLEADSDAGQPSDHKMILMIPLNTVENKKKVEKKCIETRVFCEDNFLAMGRMLEASDWGFLRNFPSINERMKAFHDELFRMFDHCFPEKKKYIYSESESFMTGALLKLRRKKNREFDKHRKSPKYIQLDLRYKEMLSKSMKQFYKKRIVKPWPQTLSPKTKKPKRGLGLTLKSHGPPPHPTPPHHHHPTTHNF